MSGLILVYQLMFGWLPVWFQIMVLALIGYFALIIVLKIIALVLDAIPLL